MTTPLVRAIGGLLLFFALILGAAAADFDAQLLAIQQAWAIANYQEPSGDARLRAFDKLSNHADALARQYPQRAEPLIWEGIVLSTYAGAKGGLGALGLAKRSRTALEEAIRIDPKALDGSAYTSLGTLYYKVPSFPLGFGNDEKARHYLEQALSLNPAGIDPNYFYGEFLYEHKDYAQARQHLQVALLAEPRPGREVADHGRREEIEALLAKVNATTSRGM